MCSFARLSLWPSAALLALMFHPLRTSAQNTAAPDSTPPAAASHDITSRVRRMLNFDHFGIAIGPSVGFRRPGWASANQLSLGFAGGFSLGADSTHHRHAGLIPAFSVDIFPKHVFAIDTATGSANVTSMISARSVMAGLGWSQPLSGAVSAVVTGSAGYVFNSVGTTTRTGGSSQFAVSAPPASIANSTAWNLTGRLWYQPHSRLVVLGGLSYYHTRPALALVGASPQAWNMDEFRAQLGVAYTIYRR